LLEKDERVSRDLGLLIMYQKVLLALVPEAYGEGKLADVALYPGEGCCRDLAFLSLFFLHLFLCIDPGNETTEMQRVMPFLAVT
jgi:hypothetical protein